MGDTKNSLLTASEMIETATNGTVKIEDYVLVWPEYQEILQIAEDNKIDIGTEEGMRQIVLALTKKSA